MSDLIEKERELASLEVSDEIQGKKLSIEQKKALEREAKAKYGRDWKKILGYVKALKPDMETVHSMYGDGLGDLKDLNNPSKVFGHKGELDG